MMFITDETGTKRFIETSDNTPYASCRLVPSLAVKNTEDEEGCISLSAICSKSKH
jgi:hypothetical protein